ncbi:1-acyl-sn-glycerol-3-phosphate acyltransferase [uncultured Duncaniella sp.]|uniref:1-acyl-sn-glycerol-3-phosphate acyltransferase n=1 Tax=uncultured Duncaniella sp. TaxID=2768039 RepID=UPI0025EC7D57|nr:1-acyl-sn-glycerol-3-phosphate acyltransferase [uncultured Duncaniella sp.]
MDAPELDYTEIAPYDDSQFAERIAELVEEPGFEHAVRWVLPDVDYDQFVNLLGSIKTKKEFQINIMQKFLEELEAHTTAGITMSGLENVRQELSYAFVSNHRDIVLDASFINLCFLRNGMRTSEVAIGDNLLIYNWITHLVKLNGSFIVKRNLPARQALEGARQLSSYIHHAISSKHESIWIAQRQGRAKDSSDHTQESVIKMLALGGEGSVAQRLAELNIFPVSISYEYDPNDYLKTREYLLRHRDPDFKKSQHDDLFSMETGLLGYKGKVHIAFSSCISSLIESLPADTDKQEVYRRVCHCIDCGIHGGYKIYPINYVAYDRAFDSDMYSDRYSSEEADKVTSYIEGQLDKIDVPDVTVQERNFMRTYMYTMYANPLRNKLIAAGYC